MIWAITVLFIAQFIKSWFKESSTFTALYVSLEWHFGVIVWCSWFFFLLVEVPLLSHMFLFTGSQWYIFMTVLQYWCLCHSFKRIIMHFIWQRVCPVSHIWQPCTVILVYNSCSNNNLSFQVCIWPVSSWTLMLSSHKCVCEKVQDYDTSHLLLCIYIRWDKELFSVWL